MITRRSYAKTFIFQCRQLGRIMIFAKMKFAERYKERHGSDRWQPFKPGEKVKFVNHYSDIDSEKFSRRYRGLLLFIVGVA